MWRGEKKKNKSKTTSPVNTWENKKAPSTKKLGQEVSVYCQNQDTNAKKTFSNQMVTPEAGSPKQILLRRRGHRRIGRFPELYWTKKALLILSCNTLEASEKLMAHFK